jgi:hypothetical protein
LGGCHEIVVDFCHAISRRYFINCSAVRPERHGSIANRNRLRCASTHHGRSVEAGSEATQGEANGKRGGIPPGIVSHSNAIGCA